MSIAATNVTQRYRPKRTKRVCAFTAPWTDTLHISAQLRSTTSKYLRWIPSALLKVLKLPIHRPGSEMSIDRLDLHIHTGKKQEAAFQADVRQQLAAIALQLIAITTTLATVLSQETKIMASELDLETLVTDLNTATNAMGVKQDAEIAEITALKAQIAAGVPVTQEQLDAVVAGLQPISDKLKAMGADPVVPIPPDSPAA